MASARATPPTAARGRLRFGFSTTAATTLAHSSPRKAQKIGVPEDTVAAKSDPPLTFQEAANTSGRK